MSQSEERSKTHSASAWEISSLAKKAFVSFLLAVTSLAYGAELVVTAVDRESGKALPSARVTLRFGDTTKAEDVLTDRNGQVHFRDLKSGGLYSAVVWFPGYRKEVIADLTVPEEGPKQITVELSEYKAVSLIALLAAPDRFDGKPVKVVGFLSIANENNAIYLHKEDWKETIAGNAIWLDLFHSHVGPLTSLRGGYVLVEGDFNSKRRGHMDLFGGSIVNIVRVVQWPQR